MKIDLEYVKLGAWGFVIGCIFSIVVGFSWGGWVTGGTTERIAKERATTAVTAALVPVCVEKAKADPRGAKQLEALKALSSPWEQRDAVVKAGWATFGGDELNRDVGEACATALLKSSGK
ncbi:MAG TPA: hypothetical protein VJK04_02840 [Candidatus Paceibacterota bacterium]